MAKEENKSLANTARGLYEYMKEKNTDAIHFSMEDCFGKKGVSVVLSVYDQTKPAHLELAEIKDSPLTEAFDLENENWEESK